MYSFTVTGASWAPEVRDAFDVQFDAVVAANSNHSIDRNNARDAAKHATNLLENNNKDISITVSGDITVVSNKATAVSLTVSGSLVP